MREQRESRNFVFDPLELPGLTRVRPKLNRDSRGWLAEVYNRAEFAEVGLGEVFSHENQSFSEEAGIMRGLHYSLPAAAKLIRVPAGRIFNVCVDIRPQSQTFGCWTGQILDAQDSEAIHMAPGFAHGVCTLAPQTVIAYFVSRPFNPIEHKGVFWRDPDLAIDWHWPHDRMIVSERDSRSPSWQSVTAYLQTGVGPDQ